MLKLTFADQTGRLTDEKLRAEAEKYAPLLAGMKEKMGLDPMSTGWMELEKWAGEDTLSRLESIAGEIRQKADAFVVIGVGGSNNAARSMVEALKRPGNPETIWAGNTLSAPAMNRMLRSLEGKDFYIDCIAKNFETLEPGAAFRVLRRALREKYGADYPARVIATGTIGSPLEALCQKEGFTFLPFPTDIGGRYTALSNVGLLPAAVAGLDIRKVTGGARKMREAVYSLPPGENPALLYAAARHLLYEAGYRVEMLASFEPALGWFYKWWIQLFAESEGKEGKGLFPVASAYSEELHSVGQFVQEGSPILFETFLEVGETGEKLSLAPDGVSDGFDYLDGKDYGDLNAAAAEATRTAHSRRLPVLTLSVPRIDEETFGELFAFFQYACVLSSGMLGVNPFDQPGVEAYKRWMFKALGKREWDL